MSEFGVWYVVGLLTVYVLASLAVVVDMFCNRSRRFGENEKCWRKRK